MTQQIDTSTGVPITPVSLTGRDAMYQRILVNQTISASGIISQVVNTGSGTKAVNASFKTNAAASVSIYPCDANGVPLASGSSLAYTSASSATNGAAIVQEMGGVSYVAIYVTDKSGAANTCQYVDLTWTKS